MKNNCKICMNILKTIQARMYLNFSSDTGKREGARRPLSDVLDTGMNPYILIV